MGKAVRVDAPIPEGLFAEGLHCRGVQVAGTLVERDPLEVDVRFLQEYAVKPDDSLPFGRN